jgi:hypothetical protein
MLDHLLKFLLTKQRLDRLGLRETTQEDLDQLIPIIEFMCEPQHKGVLIEPQPAYKHIAEWWKRVPAKLPVNKTSPRDAFGAVAMTSKDCLPLLDGMGLGYMMLSAADLHVRTDSTRNMEVRSGPTYSAGSQHSSDQLGKDYPTYPMPAIKFHNPWVIKTRPGYSTLFIPPMNHTNEERFRCMAAVVDTDTYPKQVNFPGLWFAKDYDGTVKAGTPLVTAIPFRRADVPRELLIRTITAAEQFEINRMSHVQNARSGFYTRELRESRK